MEGLEGPAYPSLGPFATLYQDWIESNQRDAAIEARLTATYRDVWAMGDALEQTCVLYFLLDRPQADEVPLILDAMGSEDSRVAEHAAIMATGWLLDGRDLGSDILDRFRAFVLRHPMGSSTRLRRLLRPGDGWPEGRPFFQLYERWMSEPLPLDSEITKDLAAMYQHAWDEGDAVDRAFVLHFLGYGMADPRPDLVLQGVRSDDYRLAGTAMFYLHYEIEAGHDLGPDIRDVIREHVRRFPQSYSMAVGAFLDLNKREGKEPS